MHVESHPAADQELAAEAAYINERREGSGEAFIRAVREQVRLLSEHPRAGSPRQRQVRRMRVPGFRYDIVYKLRNDGVLFIVAIAHQSRRPAYWRDRLK